MGTPTKITVKEKPGKKNEFVVDNRYTIHAKTRSFKRRFASGELAAGVYLAQDPRDTIAYMQIETDPSTIIESTYSRPNKQPKNQLVARGLQEIRLSIDMLRATADLWEAGLEKATEKSNEQAETLSPSTASISSDLPFVTANMQTMLCPRCRRPLEVRETGYGPIYGCTGFHLKGNNKCEYFLDKVKADRLDIRTLKVANPADTQSN